MAVITEKDLLFFHEAHRAFTKDESLSTYRNDENTHIALRTSGTNLRDSILVFEIDFIAEFDGVLKVGRPLVLGE